MPTNPAPQNPGKIATKFKIPIAPPVDMRWLLHSVKYLRLLLVVQVIILYVVTLVLYRTDVLPHWFDNAVQETGVWMVFGKKTYNPKEVEGMQIFDPSLSRVVSEYVHQTTISGYITDIEVNGDELEEIELRLMDAQSAKLEGPYTVGSVLQRVCEDTTICSGTVFEKTDLTELIPGQQVRIVMRRVSDGSPEISKIYILED